LFFCYSVFSSLVKTSELSQLAGLRLQIANFSMFN
jgi:hypothetical protein